MFLIILCYIVLLYCVVVYLILLYICCFIILYPMLWLVYCICSCIGSFIRSYFVLYFVYISIYLIYIYIHTMAHNAITQLMGALISIIWKSQQTHRRSASRVPPCGARQLPEVLRHFAAAGKRGPRALEKENIQRCLRGTCGGLEWRKRGKNPEKPQGHGKPSNFFLVHTCVEEDGAEPPPFWLPKTVFWHSKHKVDGQTPVSVGMAKPYAGSSRAGALEAGSAGWICWTWQNPWERHGKMYDINTQLVELHGWNLLKSTRMLGSNVLRRGLCALFWNCRLHCSMTDSGRISMKFCQLAGFVEVGSLGCLEGMQAPGLVGGLVMMLPLLCLQM